MHMHLWLRACVRPVSQAFIILVQRKQRYDWDYALCVCVCLCACQQQHLIYAVTHRGRRRGRLYTTSRLKALLQSACLSMHGVL